MNATKRELIEIQTTPMQLREIADKLDAAWAKARLGEEVPRHITRDYTNKIELHYVIDQDEKHDEERQAAKSPR